VVTKKISKILDIFNLKINFLASKTFFQFYLKDILFTYTLGKRRFK